MKLGTIISAAFLPLLLLRGSFYRLLVRSAEEQYQPQRAFLLDFGICVTGSVLVNGYNYFFLGFPGPSLLSFTIGCLIAGFFIGIDSSLAQERIVISRIRKDDVTAPLPTRVFSLTKKFTLVAGFATFFVSLVLIMVFVRDVDWLVRVSQDNESLNQARLSVFFEISFIMGVLLLLILNMIIAYSKNLKLLFNNQTTILERVRKGDLSTKVPVATRDEFGIIAGHTNHMIDGLRHRFELINSLRFAEEVQQNLLPSKSPFLKEYDVSGCSIYCEQTGGDYFDYFLLPDDKFGIVVADSCGHGVGAAMLMTAVRAYFIAGVQNYSDPEQLINTVNAALVKDCSANSMFTTLMFLELDQRRKSISWIRAGHDPALHYHRDTGEFTELDGRGVALGLEEGYPFKTQTINTLGSGDILLVSTDGIHETFNAQQEQFGKKRVRDIIAANRDNSARVIMHALVYEAKQYRGDLPQEDDLTLVVIKVK